MQTKLAMDEPGDEYEQEADRVAERVMRMPEPQHEGACDCGGGCSECQTVHPGYSHERLQTQRIGSHEVKGAPVPNIVREALASPGQCLDSATRAFMESRFGRDFSHVRVHTNARAAESARAVNAIAYTVGHDLVFNHGQYEPATWEGKRLLAHELTHVAQQSEVSPRQGVAQRQSAGPASAPSSPPVSATVFHPGVNHGHIPSGRWTDVQKNPNSSFWANRACANFSPQVVVGIAINQEFADKPLGLEHLNWYLGNGGGADFVEDGHVDRMLRTDTTFQALLAGFIPSRAPANGQHTAHVRVTQDDYQNQDFRFAFGAIDRLDFEVDFKTGVVHAWFQDRYEWHPVYPALYSAQSGDVVRETNCVHAALVELKSEGASDFWMKGEATVPLSIIRSGSGAGGSGAGAGAKGNTL